MLQKAKYIRTIDNEIIVFTELIKHDEFRSFRPISAGFIYFEKDTSKPFEMNAVCYGESISLRLKSDPTDSALANKQILGHY
jgi:hypothetical protein